MLPGQQTGAFAFMPIICWLLQEPSKEVSGRKKRTVRSAVGPQACFTCTHRSTLREHSSHVTVLVVNNV